MDSLRLLQWLKNLFIQSDYELPEPPQPPGGDAVGTVGLPWSSAKPVFDVVNPPDEQPGFREVGVVLNVTPTIEKYNSINLRLTPKVTEFDGFIEYGGNNCSHRCAGGGGSPPLIIQPSGALMPIFSVRKVDTQVSIFDGATVIIGGLTREEVKTVNDKIPVLGNFPLLENFSNPMLRVIKKEICLFLLVRVLFQRGALLFVRSFKTLALNPFLKIQSS